MYTSTILLLFACQKTPPSPAAPPPVQPETTEAVAVETSEPVAAEAPPEEESSSAPLISFEGVNNIVLIASDGTRIDAKDAVAGTYQAVATFTGKDSQGEREMEIAIQDLTLSKEAPIMVRCEWSLINEQKMTVDCQVSPQEQVSE